MMEVKNRKRLPLAGQILEDGVLQVVVAEDEGLDADVGCQRGHPQTTQKIPLLSSLASVAW
jgi:hypothetical protein